MICWRKKPKIGISFVLGKGTTSQQPQLSILSFKIKLKNFFFILFNNEIKEIFLNNHYILSLEIYSWFEPICQYPILNNKPSKE